jgi:hypothetical protein
VIERWRILGVRVTLIEGESGVIMKWQLQLWFLPDLRSVSTKGEPETDEI